MLRKQEGNAHLDLCRMYNPLQNLVLVHIKLQSMHFNEVSKTHAMYLEHILNQSEYINKPYL